MFPFAYGYRLLISAFAGTVAAVGFAADPQFDSENVDHLVPIGGTIDAAYDKLLSRELYRTPANYVRVVVLPSAGSVGETAFSLHSDRSNPEEATLTCTRAQQNLWSAAFHLDETLAREPTVKVQRSDIPFPKALATSLSEIVGKLIRKSRQPTDTDRLIIHGTDILFSTVDEHGRIIWARLAPESAGQTSSALRNLAGLLDNFCQSDPADRASLAERMQTEATRLERNE